MRALLYYLEVAFGVLGLVSLVAVVIVSIVDTDLMIGRYPALRLAVAGLAMSGALRTLLATSRLRHRAPGLKRKR